MSVIQYDTNPFCTKSPIFGTVPGLAQALIHTIQILFTNVEKEI